MKSVRPMDLNERAVKICSLGTLLINSIEGDLYAVVEVNGEKKAQLVGSSGKYEILKHLQLHHIIQDFSPLTFDKGTMWYNTEMIYVEPSDATEAYITIQAETFPGSGVYNWKTILPRTSASNVIIGKDTNNRPITLESLIKQGTMNVIPKIDYYQAERGEIYIESDNTIWWKNGPDPADKRLLASANTYLIDRLKQAIHWGENPPTHYDRNSMWIKDGDDAGIINALTHSFYRANSTISTGLKFAKDFQDKIKSASVISGEDKVLTVDLNATENMGHVVVNYSFLQNTKSYFEIDIHDPEEKAYLLFLKTGATQTTSENVYGTELNELSLLIDKDKSKYKNTDVTKAFRLHGRTVFVMVDKGPTSAGLKLGYVLDDGTLEYVYGSATTNGFTQDTAHFAIGTATSATGGAKATFRIKGFKVVKIPEGYVGLNNTLPDEEPFVNIAPLTNAASVYLTATQSLDNVHAGNGRLITTPRNWTDRTSAKAGELLLDHDNKILYGKGLDGKEFNIGGVYDARILKHLDHSLKVVNEPVTSLTKDAEDPTKIYITKGNNDFATNLTNNTAIRGIMSVIDNSPQGDSNTYKLIIPYSDTLAVWHDWTTIKGNVRKHADVKTYLDELHDLIKNYILSDSVYSSYKEFEITEADLNTRYTTDTLFFRYIAENKMKSESIYLETVAQASTSVKKIDQLFNAPEAGFVTTYKDANNKLYMNLYGVSGKKYIASISVNYKILRWNEEIVDFDGTTTIPTNLVVNSKAKSNTLEVTGESNLAGGIRSTNDNWSVRLTNTLAGITDKRVFGHAGIKGSNLTITMGDEDNFDYISLESKNKPYWLRKLANGSFQKEYWILQSDIDRAWNYKGSLASGTNDTLDLNNLKNNDSVGYYTLSLPISKINRNFPKDNEISFLEVAKDSNSVIQRLTSVGSKSVSIYTRIFDGSSWTLWKRTANEEDLDVKYDKVGGIISGSSTINQNLSVLGNSTLNKIFLTSEMKTGATSAIGERKIISVKNVGGENYITVGEAGVNRFEFETASVPGWVTSNTFKPFALNEAVENVAVNLRDNYTNNTELKKKLDVLATNKALEDGLKRKLNNDGDNGTGNYTFTSGTFKIGTATKTDLTSSKLTLPYASISSELNDNKESFKTNYNSIFKNNTTVAQYNTPGNGRSLIFSFGHPNLTVESGVPSAGYFRLDSDGTLKFASTNAHNIDSTTEFDKIMRASDMATSLVTGTATQLVTGSQGKLLYTLSVAKNKGPLSNSYTGGVFDYSKLILLEPGNYYVNGDADLVKLGLNKDKIHNEGILLIQSENTANGNILTYVPFTNKNQDANTVAFYNPKKDSSTANVDTKWVYVSDDSKYYTRNEIDALLNKIKKEIMDLFISDRYSYTGNSKNIALPYRLVHTHNSEGIAGIDNTKPITFLTNIDLSTTGLNANTSAVLIELKGFSYGSAHPIHTIISIVLKKSGSTTVIDNDKSDIYNATPAPIICTYSMVDGKLAFTVFDDRSMENISFDTYMRFSGVGNLKFMPEITHYKVDGGNNTSSTRLFNNHDIERGPFNNTL